MAHALSGIPEVRGMSGRFDEAPVTRRSFERVTPPDREANSMVIVLEYPLHDGARTALRVVAILCIVLAVTAPVGLWMLLRMPKCKVQITRTGVVARGVFQTVEFRFDEVARLGWLEVPISARGIGGALARQRFGGDHAVHLVVRTRSGRTRRFVASTYERHSELFSEIILRTRKPCEGVKVGLFGLRWPEDVAFS